MLLCGPAPGARDATMEHVIPHCPYQQRNGVFCWACAEAIPGESKHMPVSLSPETAVGRVGG